MAEGPDASRPQERAPSLHVEPAGMHATAQHYIRDLIYGANDGILTTFAVVAGVTGGTLPLRAVLILGAANLVADGLSMGVGNYLGIQAEERAREAQGLAEREAYPVRHGLATFLAFVVAGAAPLVPYVVVPALAAWHFPLAAVTALVTLFLVGAARARVTTESWWRSGAEMLLLGTAVALVAYFIGGLIAGLV